MKFKYMFIDLVLNIFSSVITAIAGVLPTFTIWPAIVINGIRDFCGYIMMLNWIFPTDSFLHCIAFFVEFIGWYFFAKLIIWFFNWARGADGVKI